VAGLGRANYRVKQPAGVVVASKVTEKRISPQRHRDTEENQKPKTFYHEDTKNTKNMKKVFSARGAQPKNLFVPFVLFVSSW
jgi:hypothetical protein